MSLELFMSPRSLALVGVSRRTGDGSNVLEHLLSYGFKGRLYPVNPHASEILGVRAYPSVRELPERVDLALVSTPRDVVPEVVAECLEAGIRAIIVVAQGFADSGEEGRRLQEELVARARRRGARILGPNTFGVANAFINLNTAFVRFNMERVPIGSLANSGILFAGTSRLRFIGKAIDLGNACDIDFPEGLEYFGDDPEVRVIVLFMERVRDGRRFLEVARRVAFKKPIIALKTGRTDLGVRLARSHTGALAGGDEVYDAAFKQCGILRAGDTGELEDLVFSFLHLSPPKGNRLAVLTVTMGAGVMAADAAALLGWELPGLPSGVKERIARFFPRWMDPGNPVDLGITQFSPYGMAEAFAEIIHAVMSEEIYDAVLLITPIEPAAFFLPSVLKEAGARRDKPIACWLYAPDPVREMEREYMKAGTVVVYPTVERAIRSLARLLEYRRFTESRPACLSR